MKKILLTALTLGIVVAGTAVVFGQTSPDALGGATQPMGATTTTDGQAVDVSGPCDEAEHVNDPRCTGAPRVDNSGPGSIDDDRFDDDRGDHDEDDHWDDHPGRGCDDDHWDDD